MTHYYLIPPPPSTVVTDGFPNGIQRDLNHSSDQFFVNKVRFSQACVRRNNECQIKIWKVHHIRLLAGIDPVMRLAAARSPGIPLHDDAQSITGRWIP